MVRLAVLGIVSTVALVSACVDGRAPTGLETDGPVFFQILPSYSPLGAGFAEEEINHIRVTVRVEATDSVLTVFRQDVDPNADEWRLEIPVEIQGKTSLAVVLLIELVFKAANGTESTQWSGRSTAQVSTGQTSGQVQQVPVFRGPPDNLDIASVSIGDPERDTVIEGDTLTLQATVQGGGGSTQVFWGSLDATVAGVSVAGLVTSVGPGIARISVVAGPRADTVSIAVLQAITAVQLPADSVLIDALGDTIDLGARVIDPRGDSVAGAHLAYEVADTAVVRQLGDGRFAALTNGTTSVTITGSRTAPVNGGGQGVASRAVPDTAVQATATIVVAQAAAEVRLPDSLAFRSLGDTATLVAATLDEGGSPVDSAVVVWTVADSAVVSVDGNGLVTTLGNGMTIVVATSGQAADSTRVKVLQVAKSLIQTPELDTLRTHGEELQLEVAMADSLEAPMLDTVPLWATSDTAVVTVDTTGLVVAVGTGTAEVVASIDSIADTTTVVVRFSSATVVIARPPPADTIRSLGATLQFTAAVLDDQGDTIPDRPVAWDLTNSSLATVDSAGLLTSVANGSLGVIASSEGASDTATVVIQQRLFSVGIAPAADSLNDGDTLALTAVATDSLGNDVSGLTPEWASTKPRIAFVQALQGLSARVIGLDTGTVEISVVIEDFVATKVVVVRDGTPVRIDVRPDLASVRSGQTVALSAVPVTANEKDTGLPDSLTVSWSSSDTSVVAVSASGVVTGRDVGQTYVRATAGTFVDSSLVSVTPGTAVSLEFLIPNAADTTVSAGDTVLLSLEGHDARGHRIATGWTLSAADTSVVAVIGDSALVGHRADSTTITATLDLATAAVRVTVSPGPVLGVSVLRPSTDTTMTAGGSVPLRAEARDVFGNLVPRAFTFTSGAPATVRISGDSAYAEAVGTAQVVATADGVTGAVDITVAHGSAVALAFSNPVGDSVKLGVGDSLVTSAGATDAFGNAFTDGITYLSRDTSAARVDPSGLVVAGAVSGQRTWIVANRDAAADSFHVTTKESGLARVDLLPDTGTLTVLSDTMTFALLPFDRFGNPVFAVTFGFTVSDGTVAAIQLTGDTTVAPAAFDGRFPQIFARYPNLATADSIHLGFVTVVSAGNGQAALVGQGTLDGVTGSDTSTVVVAIQPASATLAPDIARLASLGESVPLTATARDANNNVIPGEAFTFATSDAAVATVDNTGVAIAVSNGTAVITATTSNGVSATSIVTVQQQTTAVTVTPVAATASSFGDTLVFRAQAVDAGGSQVAGATFSWQFVDGVGLGSLLAAGDSVAFIAQSNGTDGIRATSGGMSATADVVVSQTPASVAIAPDSVHFTSIGDGATYRGSVSDARGNAVVGASYAWTLAGTSVQFNGVTNAETAQVTTVGSGATTLTLAATRDGITAQGTAKAVVDVAAATVTLTPDAVTLTSLGDSTTFTATARDGNNNVIVGEPFTLSSSSPAVATVDNTGVAIAVSNGTAVITATTSNGVSATSIVTVQQQTTAVTVTPVAATASSFGDTLVFRAQAVDAGGSQVAGATFSWQFVDGVGLGSLLAAGDSVAFIAQSNGTDGIRATSGGMSATADVVVSQTPASVAIAPDSVHFTSIGDGATYRGSVSDARGNAVVGASYAWTLAGTSVQFNGVTNAETAQVTTVGSGATTLTLAATRDGITAQGTAKAVVDVAAATVTLTPDAVTLTSLGDSTTFTATARDGNNNVIVGEPFTLSSSSPAVATVDNTGVAIAVSNGTAVITATTSNGVSATSIVTVQQQTTAVTVTPVAATASSFGDTLVFRAQAVDAGGSQVAGATFSWQFVDGVGLGSLLAAGDSVAFIAQSNGTDGIRATSGGMSATADVVVSQTPASVAIAPDSVHFTSIGDGATYRGSVSDARGNAVVGASYAWTLAGTSVQFNGVTNAETAQVTTVGSGATTLTLAATRDGITAQGTAKAVVDVKANTVTIVPDTATLEALNATVDLSGRVTAKDANGNTIQNPAVSWTSTDIAVATVSGAGVVTAVAGGPPVGIIAMVDAVSDTATVTVDIKADSIVISPVADTTAVDGNVQFTAMTFSGGQAITATVAWTSTVAATATVDNTGKATGVAAGVTKIVATSGNVADTASLGVADGNSIISTAFPNAQALATATVGDTVTVAVTFDMGRVDATGDVGSVQFDLDYDATVFEAASGTTGVSGNPNLNLGIDGKVKFGFIATSAQGSSNLTLATIKFVVKAGAAKGRSAFTLTYTAVPTDTSFGALPAPVAVAGEVQIN